MEKILVIDDDQEIQKALFLAGRNESFTITGAFSVNEARQLLTQEQFDLILLDIMLPDGNGFDLLQIIRGNENYTPVICLSEKDDEAFKVAGLGIGADDYITKPFSFSLLKSKIKALIRRNTLYTREQHIAIAGPFAYDPRQLTITMHGQPLELTSRELQMLRLFLENPGRVYTKEQIYTLVWNNHAVDDNTITVYIRRLREKIEAEPSHPQYLLTVWGIGYKFSVT